MVTIEPNRSMLHKALWFVAHQAISTFGVLIAAAFIVETSFAFLIRIAPFFSERNAHRILTEIGWHPVQLGLGLCLGWAFFRLTRQRMIRWMFVLPALFLFYAVNVFAATVSPHLADFWTATCPPARNCVYRIASMIPLMSSAGYSLGGALASRRGSSWKS